MSQDWEKWIFIDVRNPGLTNTEALDEILKVTSTSPNPCGKVLCEQQPDGLDVF